MIGFLATGDELVEGNTLNTNTKLISEVLHSEGFSIGNHLICSDREDDMIDCLHFLEKHHKTIIISGGLGPTSDDKTRFALAKMIKNDLIPYDDAIKHIESRLSHANLPMTDGHFQQCLFPKDATLFSNTYGTAFGCAVKTKTHLYFLLPGPPRECIPMFNHWVLPMLTEEEKTGLIQLKWRLFGVAEGDIAHRLDEAVKEFPCRTGYRLDIPYTECKVYCESSLVKPITDKIGPLLMPHQLYSDNKKASQVLIEWLKNNKTTINIHDNVTGGRLEQLLRKPETNAYLHFHEPYHSGIHFYFEGLHEFWDQAISKQSSLSLTFEHDGIKEEETKVLPFRSAFVIDMATEWLCFRMTSLLDKIH